MINFVPPAGATPEQSHNAREAFLSINEYINKHNTFGVVEAFIPPPLDRPNTARFCSFAARALDPSLDLTVYEQNPDTRTYKPVFRNRVAYSPDGYQKIIDEKPQPVTPEEIELIEASLLAVHQEKVREEEREKNDPKGGKFLKAARAILRLEPSDSHSFRPAGSI